MTVKQEQIGGVEKTSKKDLEKVKVGNFLKNLEETYKKIQEKFGFPLEKKERIDANFFGYLYRCPKGEREGNFYKYRLELENLDAPLFVPRKITLTGKGEGREIVSLSFMWDNKIENHDLFLKIIAEKGKISALERRTKPNMIIKNPQNPDPETREYSQMMLVVVDYEKKQVKLTLGHFNPIGERVSFIYPEVNKQRSQKMTFKGIIVPKPSFEKIAERFQKIQKELLS